MSSESGAEPHDDAWSEIVQGLVLEQAQRDLRMDRAWASLGSRDSRSAYAQAVEVLSDNDEDAEALQVVVLSLMRMREPKKALKTADRLVTLAPEAWQAHIAKSWALIGAKQQRAANDVAIDAARLAPDDVNALVAVAEITARSAKYAAFTRKLVDRILELDPESPDARRVAGDLAAARSNYRAAIHAYEEGLAVDPTNARLLQRLASVQRANRQKGAAADTYQRLAEVAPQRVMPDPEPPPETPASIRNLGRGCFLWFWLGLGALVLGGIAPFWVPLIPTVVAGAFTAWEKPRRAYARRRNPVKMAAASTKETWKEQNPDIVVGLAITGALALLTLWSLYVDLVL